jgi:hypothetical protein
MPKDACYRKVMKSYGKWSARAAQATAKCRKKKGKVTKSKAGSNLKRWTKEKWVDTRTGKQVNLVEQEVRVNTADHPSECLQRHRLLSRRCLSLRYRKNKERKQGLVNRVQEERRSLQ